MDLAGGTLDLWPLYDFLGEACTVNLAISVSTEAHLQLLKGPEVHLESLDFKKSWKFENQQAFLSSRDSKLRLFQSLARHFPLAKGWSLRTSSESPVGGGLGGSSSLLISMIKCFLKASAQSWSVSQIVDFAHHVEAQVLNTPTGTQDYFPPLLGGLSVLHYSARGIRHESIDFSQSPLETHFMLVYTGQSHHSGINNFEVLKKAVQKDKNTLKNLKKLSEIALNTRKCLEQRDWKALPRIFHAEYEARTALEPSFGSDKIEKLRSVALNAGARAAKICGAGGGGCVLLWVEPEKHEAVREACQKNSFQVLSASPQGILAPA